MLGPRQTIHSIVVAGLGPATHEPQYAPCRFPWMPGRKPGKTIILILHHLNASEQ